MSELIKSDQEYKEWISEISKRFRQYQIKAAMAVNSGMLAFYWSLGRDIVRMKAEFRWGSSFYENLSIDLHNVLPQSSGFSPTNLRYMKRFYELYAPYVTTGIQQDDQNNAIQAQVVPELKKLKRAQVVPELKKLKRAQVVPEIELGTIFSIPWGHHRNILVKCKGNPQKALFYIQQTLENNWSRAVLLNFLDTNLFERQGKAITNFKATLPSEKSDLAQEITRDPYCFDFLALTTGYHEKELKDALMDNIAKFLLELGKGFAFLGREYRLQVGETEQFIDMLFYNIILRCYVVVEVKVSEFTPADIGQLITYVSAVDGILRKQEDTQTIGLLICKTKDNVLAKYATAGAALPIGISEYELSNLLPDKFKGTLPSITEIENELKAPDERS